MLRHGPRIVFKDDRDSSIGRGAIMFWSHFVSPMSDLLVAMAQTAPALIDNTMVVSEGWRDIRTSRDLHEELRALDFPLNKLVGITVWGERQDAGLMWVERARAVLRPDLRPGFQFEVHGSGEGIHVHAEWDP